MAAFASKPDTTNGPNQTNDAFWHRSHVVKSRRREDERHLRVPPTILPV